MEYRASSAVFKKLSNGSSFNDKSAYDGIFTATSRIGAPVFPARADDYAEIFGGRASSIPVLDFPSLNERKLPVDGKSSTLEYAKVFGGFEELDFAVSYEDLFAERPKATNFSEKPRKPAASKSRPAAKDHSESPKKNKVFSREGEQRSVDNEKKISIPYQKVKPGSKTRTKGTTSIAQLDEVPGYLADELTPQVNQGDKLSSGATNDALPKSNCNQTAEERKGTQAEVMETPVSDASRQRSAAAEFRSRPDFHESNNVKKGSQAGVVEPPSSDSTGQRSDAAEFHSRPDCYESNNVNMSFDSFQVGQGVDSPQKPSNSVMQPKFGDNHSRAWIPKSLNPGVCDDSSKVGRTSLPYFEDEVDMNSVAAASVNALKKAMEDAQARIKIAKESMERRKASLRNPQKLKSRVSLNAKERSETHSVKLSVSKETSHVTNGKADVGEQASAERETKKWARAYLATPRVELVHSTIEEAVVEAHNNDKMVPVDFSQGGKREAKERTFTIDNVAGDNARERFEKVDNAKNILKLVNEHTREEDNATMENHQMLEDFGDRLTTHEEAHEQKNTEKKIGVVDRIFGWGGYINKLMSNQMVPEREDNYQRTKVAQIPEATESEVNVVHEDEHFHDSYGVFQGPLEYEKEQKTEELKENKSQNQDRRMVADEWEEKSETKEVCEQEEDDIPTGEDVENEPGKVNEELEENKSQNHEGRMVANEREEKAETKEVGEQEEIDTPAAEDFEREPGKVNEELEENKSQNQERRMVANDGEQKEGSEQEENDFPRGEDVEKEHGKVNEREDAETQANYLCVELETQKMKEDGGSEGNTEHQEGKEREKMMDRFHDRVILSEERDESDAKMMQTLISEGAGGDSRVKETPDELRNNENNAEATVNSCENRDIDSLNIANGAGIFVEGEFPEVGDEFVENEVNLINDYKAKEAARFIENEVPEAEDEFVDLTFEVPELLVTKIMVEVSETTFETVSGDLVSEAAKRSDEVEAKPFPETSPLSEDTVQCSSILNATVEAHVEMEEDAFQCGIVADATEERIENLVSEPQGMDLGGNDMGTPQEQFCEDVEELRSTCSTENAADIFNSEMRGSSKTEIAPNLEEDGNYSEFCYEEVLVDDMRGEEGSKPIKIYEENGEFTEEDEVIMAIQNTVVIEEKLPPMDETEIDDNLEVGLEPTGNKIGAAQESDVLEGNGGTMDHDIQKGPSGAKQDENDLQSQMEGLLKDNLTSGKEVKLEFHWEDVKVDTPGVSEDEDSHTPEEEVQITETPDDFDSEEHSMETAREIKASQIAVNLNNQTNQKIEETETNDFFHKEAEQEFEETETNDSFQKEAEQESELNSCKTTQLHGLSQGHNDEEMVEEIKISQSYLGKVENQQEDPTKVEQRIEEKLGKEAAEEGKEQQRKIDAAKETEKERERERERERMAVERVIREARERAFAEARERAAAERAAAEPRQRVNAETGGMRKKPAEVDNKSKVEKDSVGAKLKALRAVVERANAEARERALEKAMSEKAFSEARNLAEKIVAERISGKPGDGVTRRSFSAPDSNQRGSSPSTSSRCANSVSGSSETVGGSAGESAQRSKARLERHQRTVERVAKALAEKNIRDLLAQREQAERNRLAETLDADVKRWSSGKEGNLRALLSTLQYILGPDSGWQPIPLTDIITTAAVKKAYRKATLFVHPDKLQQRGASIQQKYICEKVFDLLKAAWNRFNTEER